MGDCRGREGADDALPSLRRWRRWQWRALAVAGRGGRWPWPWSWLWRSLAAGRRWPCRGGALAVARVRVAFCHWIHEWVERRTITEISHFK